MTGPSGIDPHVSSTSARPHSRHNGAMEPADRNPLSPAGQVDQWGDLAWGLKHNRSGRRRAVRMLAVLVAVIIVGAALLVFLA